MNLLMMVKQNNIDLKIVPIVTFLTGFLTFLLLSIHYEVFWVDSKYDVPLIYNMSVMLGDSILLPIINYKIFYLFFNLLGKKILNKQLVYWVVFALFFSIFINYSSHRFWVQDQFTDFIGFSVGTYSIIGYWHLIFSILEVSLLMIFPYLWLQSVKRNNVQAVGYALNIWNYFFLFTLLSSLDMLNKYLFVYDIGIVETMYNEGFPFVTSIFVIGLLIVMNLLNKNSNATNSIK